MIQTKLSIDEIIKDYEKKHGPIEIDGHYGEQVAIKQDENIFMYISPWLAYREVWESSKRILDVKEDEKWMIKTKAKR